MAPTATRCPWEKGQDSSAALGITVPVSAGNCPAALPSSRTPRLHPHHDGDTSLFSKHLCPQTVLLGPRDTSPVPRQGLSEQTGITWGDTWSAQEGGDGPPHSGKPATALHDCVRIHWSRKVFGFTVALDQGGWKDGFRPTAPNCPYRTAEVPEFHSVRSKSLLGL